MILNWMAVRAAGPGLHIGATPDRATSADNATHDRTPNSRVVRASRGALRVACAARGPHCNPDHAPRDAEWRVIREEVLPPFKRACHCRVRAIHVSPELPPQRLKAVRAAGQIEIHLFAQDNMRPQELIDAGLVQLLDVADLPLDSAILPSLAAAGVFDGHRHFLPLPPNAQIACYNTATCAAAELTQPRTLDAPLQVARTLRAKDGIARVLFMAVRGAPTVTQLHEWVVSAGGDPFHFRHPGTVATPRFPRDLPPYLSPDSRRAKWDTTNDVFA